MKNKESTYCKLEADPNYDINNNSKFAVQQNKRGAIKPARVREVKTEREIAYDYVNEHPEEFYKKTGKYFPENEENSLSKEIADDVAEIIVEVITPVAEELTFRFANWISVKAKNGIEKAKSKLLKKDVSANKNENIQTSSLNNLQKTNAKFNKNSDKQSDKHIVSKETFTMMQEDIYKDANKLADKIIYLQNCIVNPNISDSTKLEYKNQLDSIPMESVQKCIGQSKNLNLNEKQIKALKNFNKISS